MPSGTVFSLLECL